MDSLQGPRISFPSSPKPARIQVPMINQLLLAVFIMFATALSALSVTPASTASGSDSQAFERRIAGRAKNILTRLDLADAARAAQVENATLTFYRNLHAVHRSRDQKLAQFPALDPHQIARIYFEADKESHAVYGKFIGALTSLLDDTQIDSIKDWMTFDMVRLNTADYQRMFPTLTERQKAQILSWLIDSREAAIVAGSAETKLDVFRANKLRMNAYLTA
jgi:hypothetical protein